MFGTLKVQSFILTEVSDCCMHVHVRACIHIHHTHLHTHTCAHIHTHTHTHTHSPTLLHTHPRTYAHTQLYGIKKADRDEKAVSRQLSHVTFTYGALHCVSESCHIFVWVMSLCEWVAVRILITRVSDPTQCVVCCSRAQVTYFFESWHYVSESGHMYVWVMALCDWVPVRILSIRTLNPMCVVCCTRAHEF